jgi:hypothetical protein
VERTPSSLPSTIAEFVTEANKSADPHRTSAPTHLDPKTAARLFTDWLREHGPDQSQPPGLDEFVTELADSWQFGCPTGLYHTCSPHRVALVVHHINDYYQDDFAANLVPMLPEWTAWLAERNGTPAHLADRCRPYAHGELHKGIMGNDGKLDCLARVTE